MGIGTGLTPGSLVGKPVSTLADQTRPMERETGIEPVSLAWKAKVLPLNYSRPGSLDPQPTTLAGCELWWRRLDSNQRTQCGQIYSLLPLTTRPPLLRQARNYSTGSSRRNRWRGRASYIAPRPAPDAAIDPTHRPASSRGRPGTHAATSGRRARAATTATLQHVALEQQRPLGLRGQLHTS